MKLSWPPGWGQETEMPLQLNLTPAAGPPCVSSIWFDSSRCFWGRDGGTRVPWWLTRGWRFGKSTLTFDVGASGVDSRSPHPIPPTPVLRGLSLAVWPLIWPLDTVHVSPVLAVGFEQQQDLQLNTNIRFISAQQKTEGRGAAALWGEYVFILEHRMNDYKAFYRP